jgi:hypothetical protein
MRDTLLAGLIHKHSPSFKRSGTRANTGQVAMPRVVSYPTEHCRLQGDSTNTLRHHVKTTLISRVYQGATLTASCARPRRLALSSLAVGAGVLYKGEPSFQSPSPRNAI